MQKNALITGSYLCHQLSTLTHDFPDIVSDVRGKGFMIGLELAENNRSKKYIKEEHMRDIFEDIKDMGVLVGKGGLSANVSINILDFTAVYILLMFFLNLGFKNNTTDVRYEGRCRFYSECY